MKADIFELIRNDLNNRFKVISGKIFDTHDNEVPQNVLFQRLMVGDLRKIYNTPIKGKDCEELLSDLNILGTTGFWPELPLFKQAKALGPIYDDSALPFPLDDKQLTIINILCFHPDLEKMFITTGIGGSGKSTFLNIIKQLFNNDVSAASVSDLANPFMVAEAVKHRLIASDELAKGELDSKVLKQLASKQLIEVNPKHIASYTVQSQSALFWCCNKTPKVDCSDSGMLRRVVFYSRNTKIQNPDPSLNRKQYTNDELLTILRRALAFENDNWEDAFIDETHALLIKSNAVGKYLIANLNNKINLSYDGYTHYCYANGFKAYNRDNYDQLMDLFKEWLDEYNL